VPSASRAAYRAAILRALFVNTLWATSWALIKIVFRAHLPPLTFAGTRYLLASLCLAAVVFARPSNRWTIGSLTPADWRRLAFLGVVYYAVSQGSQFIALSLVPAATLGLVLNLTPAIVAIVGWRRAHEPPTWMQSLGVALTTAGVLTYFWPVTLAKLAGPGILAALVGLVTNSIAAIVGRRANVGGHPAVVVTFVSMGIGSSVLLATGLTVQGWVPPGGEQWAIIAWLAVVNTAFAFTMWNRSLQTLTAVEASVINSTMLPQTAIVAALVVGEVLSATQIAGLALVVLGTFVVQLRR
jgi:drug/metabolite transporter (DMT)-like permease